MTKTKQNLILFIEPSIDPWSSPSKIGNSYINRFVIDEEASFELLGVHHLSSWGSLSQNENDIVQQKVREDFVLDNEIIDSAIKKSAEYTTKRLNTHLVFAGSSWFADFEAEIAYAIKVHKISGIMVTKLQYVRQHLITKEVMEEICKGEYFCRGAQFTNKSVFDDLESFYKNIRFRNNRKACTNRYKNAYFVQSYHLPKLTEKELKLVKLKDKDFMKTFANQLKDNGNPDVDEAEMKLSESKSKFVQIDCSRWTFIINMNGQTPSCFPKRNRDWTSRFGTNWEKWVPLINLKDLSEETCQRGWSKNANHQKYIKDL